MGPTDPYGSLCVLVGVYKYKSLCVLMGFNGCLWVLIGPSESQWVGMGFYKPYAISWVLVSLYWSLCILKCVSGSLDVHVRFYVSLYVLIGPYSSL